MVEFNSYKQTAQSYGIDHKQVQIWVKLYQAHGIDAIKRQRTKTVYDIDFKLSAVQQVMLGKSPTELAIELNLLKPALLSSWLKAYQTHGIMGLHPKRKGRQSVQKTSQAGPIPKPDEQKTQAELIAKLQHLRMERDVLKKLAALARQQEQNRSS